MFRTDLNELINTLNQLKDSIPYMNKLFIALGQSRTFFITDGKSPYLKSTDSRKYITLKEINNHFNNKEYNESIHAHINFRFKR